MKYKKLSKAEQLQLQELVDRAEANDQPLPIFNIIGRDIETPPTDTVSATLDERGKRYGDFTDHARVAQKLQDTLRNHSIPSGHGVHTTCIPWHHLTSVQKQALTVICDKLARIISGDPNYADNWHDIQGYAKLVEDRLPKSE